MASNSNGQGSSMHKVGEAEMKKPCNDQDHISKLKAEEDEVYRKLWLACAGPLANVPRVGDRVFYFPQGHIEQVEACTSKDIDVPMPIYNVPYKILCCVVSMQLQAEPNTDEVIAHITLVPEKDGETSQHQTAPSIAWESCIRSFSKKLTPSDTSTHGGLSVPRKCANECFPPLDMFQNLPAQDLIAKDLHGTEWAFRHIYRGQPKRHLLSSGWSSFVNSKKLVAGDTCIFFRGKTSKLFVGIRRAIKPETNTSASLLSSQSIQHGVLAGAFHAISTGSLFNVYYYPWKCPAEFIIPYDQYMKAAEIDYSFGMRFKMQFEATEGFRVERSPKFGGTIIGIKDIDHTRWTGSEWRCIKVKWDSEEEAAICPNRVSPWSIQVVEIYKRKRKSIPQDAKKARPFNPLFPFSVKGGKPDNGLVSGLTKNSVEHVHHGHSGVMQGQEFGIVGAYNQQTSARLPVSHLSLKPFYGWGEKQFGLDKHQLQIHDHHESTISIPGGVSTTLGIAISGSPTSASRATNHANGAKKCLSILDIDLITSKSQKKCISEAPHEVQPVDSGTCMIFGVNVLGNHPKVRSPQFVVDGELNGFDVVPTPLASQEGVSKTIHVQERSNDNLQDELCSCLHINRSCTKVVKYGTALGRSIDLSHFNGYGDLTSELDKIFEFNGALIDMSSNWRLSYTDGERDRMFGDCPWKVFQAIVKKMFICPKAKDIDDSVHARAPV